jgi:hypothetical protein
VRRPPVHHLPPTFIMLYMGDQQPLTTEITAEIARAITKLGGNPATVDLTNTWQVNRSLEFLGADMYLLATIGSWRDALPDDVILDELRTWNAGKSLAPDISFVRRSATKLTKE